MLRSFLVLSVIAMGCAPEPPQPRAPYLPEVYVEYRADDRAAVLERRYRDMPWIPVCTSPCSRTVRPDFEYRVGGEGVVASQPFRLYEPTTIEARTGWTSSRVTGTIGVSIGLPLTLIGGLLTLITLDHGLPEAWPGILVLATGGALTVGGAYQLSHGHTVVSLSDRTPVARVAFKF